MKPILIIQQKKSEMRYDTVGDYEDKKDHTRISVSKQKGYAETEDDLKGIALHELVEMWLCQKRGIKFKDIDKWDLQHQGDYEPGEVKGCCYYNEHRFANKIEKMFLKELKK